MKDVEFKRNYKYLECYNFLQCSITSEYVIRGTIFNALILLKYDVVKND